MSNAKAWISAFRLRTLPLSLSSVLMGSLLAFDHTSFSPIIFGLAIATTIFLQVLSNLANDYGDSVKGTDNDQRVGPDRAMQTGAISKKAMFKGIVITGLLALATGIALIYFGLIELGVEYILGFFALGLTAIFAAVKYTMGKNPYGYSGLGDVFVFLFFGLTGVIGTYFLHTHDFDPLILLPAAALGLMSSAVLNLNNMRDVENDERSGKNTLVVKMGVSAAKVYHTLLISFATTSLLVYTSVSGGSLLNYLFLIVTPLLALNLKKVWTYADPRDLDPELKKVALSTFALTLLYGLGILLA